MPPTYRKCLISNRPAISGTIPLHEFLRKDLNCSSHPARFEKLPLYALPSLQLPVTFGNSFKEDIREFEIATRKLHLRRPNVL